jgi:hypothetical protein
MGTRRADWMLSGECLKHPEVNFEPGKLELKKSTAAQDICDNCPVKKQCGDYAILHELGGTWGGLSEYERVELRPDLIEYLGYRAIREGWLEKHHLLTQEQLEEAQAMASEAKAHQKKDQPHRDSFDFDLPSQPTEQVGDWQIDAVWALPLGELQEAARNEQQAYSNASPEAC